MTPQGMPGDTATIYRLCQLFKTNPGLHYQTITIRQDGRVDIAAEGTHGVLMNWSRAIPVHAHTTALVPTQYGLDEADVLEADHLRITIRRPLVGPGGMR